MQCTFEMTPLDYVRHEMNGYDDFNANNATNAAKEARKMRRVWNEYLRLFLEFDTSSAYQLLGDWFPHASTDVIQGANWYLLDLFRCVVTLLLSLSVVSSLRDADCENTRNLILIALSGTAESSYC